jgi:hypothetical protein
MKHNKKNKSQRKAQEYHLEEKKTIKPTNDTKSGKPSKMTRKSSKSQKLTKLPLKQTLNASSPP